MRKGINEIKRKIRRIKEELKATREIARVTSWTGACATFRAKIDIQIMNHNGGYESPAITKRLLRKHDVMIDYLEKVFKGYWDNYSLPEITAEIPESCRNKIWVCWWQGLDNAPEIVKACVDSIRRHAGDREVVIITERNVGDYVEFPAHIMAKVRTGQITRTFYSDLLRLNLLSRYGGVWLDSTFYAVSDISGYVDEPLWSIKRPDYGHASVACGRFANYSIGCNRWHRWIYRAALDFLYNYWVDNTQLIDYLLVDYATALSIRHYKEISDVYSSISPNNRNCDELCKVLNKPFDEKLWQEIKCDTALFKLTWKAEFKTSVDGVPTFYSKLLDGTLV